MSSISLLSFPQKVYNVLRFCEEQGREDIISWENNGTAFKVNDLQVFQRDVLPRCFNTSKYYSFTRALYAHGFTCVRTGRQPGIYSHPKFNRNDPVSPSLMKRVRRKKNTKVPVMKRTVFNSSIEALNKNRTFSVKSCILNLKKFQFPSLVDETVRENDHGTEAVFGRLYHKPVPLDAPVDKVPSPPFPVPPGSELVGIFDDDDYEEFLSMGVGSHPNPIPSSSAEITRPQGETVPINSNGSHFILDDRASKSPPMAPMVVSSQVLLSMPDLEREGNHQINLIPCHAPSRGHCDTQKVFR